MFDLLIDFSVDVDMKTVPERCHICRQLVNGDLAIFEGHPDDARDEEIALIDPSLSLFNDEECGDYEEKLQHKVTQFR